MGTELLDRTQDDDTSDYRDEGKPSTPLSAAERADSDDIFKRYYGPDAKKEGLGANDLKKLDNEAIGSNSLDGKKDSEAAALISRGAAGNAETLNYSGGQGKEKGKAKVKGNFAKKRLRLAVISGLVSIVLSIVGYFAILPQKINNLISNVDKKYFASAEEAVERRSERFFSDYVRRHVIPSLNGSCPSTKVSKTCSVKVEGDSGPTRLYRAWADARLEQKLSDRHGITFERSGSGTGSTYSMTVRGESVDITGVARGELELRDVGRNEIREAWKEAYKRETRLKRVLYHFKVGRLLERKYGIKRCITACKLKDTYTDWKDRKKSAFKAKLVRRVIVPRDEALAIAFDCIFVSDCSGPASDNGEDHEQRDKFQQRVDEMLERLAREYGKEFTEEGVQKMLRELDEIDANGSGSKYQKYIMKKILQKVFREEASDKIADYGVKAIPIVGWISTAESITKIARNAGPTIRKYRYVTNSMAMVQLYSMYKTHADEIKVGNVDAEMVGSFVDALGDQTNKGETAELSPIYEEVINGPGRPGYTSSIFGGTAYAEGEKKQYTCDNNKPIPSGEVLCDEEKLTESSAGAAFIEAISNSPILGAANAVLGPFGAAIRTLTAPINSIGGALMNAPGVRQLVGALTSLAQYLEPLMKGVLDILIPTPMTPDMSGGRNATMVIGGGNAAGNEFAHYGLGSKVLTPTEINAIRTKRANDELTRFANLPFTERMFSKEESRSLMSQVAITMPSTRSSAISSFLGFKPGSLVSSIFSTKKASAQVTPTSDPFGIQQYGYALDDPALAADPEKYTPEYCKAEIEAWEKAVVKDPATQMDMHTTTSPCILEEAALASSGGYFSDSLIPTKDKIVQSLGSSYPPTAPGECPNNPVLEAETVIAEGIRVHKCIESNTRDMVLAARADGLSSFGGSGWRDTERQVELRQINGCPDVYNSPAESCVTPTARPGTSMHERGLAIDVACDGDTIGSSSPCFSWLKTNAERFGFYNLPSEPWHWSVNGR